MSHKAEPLCPECVMVSKKGIIITNDQGNKARLQAKIGLKSVNSELSTKEKPFAKEKSVEASKYTQIIPYKSLQLYTLIRTELQVI